MKTFTDEEKEIAILICKADTKKGKIFGELYTKIFAIDELALLLINNEPKCYLFFKNQENETINIGMAKLMAVLAFLDYMKECNLIYCVKNQDYQALLFCQPFHVDATIISSSMSYVYEKGKIEEVDSIMTMFDEFDHPIMDGRAYSQYLTEKLKQYFTCIIYPTSSLIDFVKNDFKTEEVRQYEQQLADTRKSLFISRTALFISLLLPVAMTFFNNRFAFSTIEQSQFNSSFKQVQLISTQLDSIIKRVDSLSVILKKQMDDRMIIESTPKKKK